MNELQDRREELTAAIGELQKQIEVVSDMLQSIQQSDKKPQ